MEWLQLIIDFASDTDNPVITFILIIMVVIGRDVAKKLWAFWKSQNATTDKAIAVTSQSIDATVDIVEDVTSNNHSNNEVVKSMATAMSNTSEAIVKISGSTETIANSAKQTADTLEAIQRSVIDIKGDTSATRTQAHNTADDLLFLKKQVAKIRDEQQIMNKNMDKKIMRIGRIVYSIKNSQKDIA